MRRRILVLSVAVVAVVASACSSGGHHSAPGTTTSTTASAGPNPDVIPSVITPAYVDAVFRVLNHIKGDATRELFAADAVDEKVRDDLRALFTDPLFAQEMANASASLKVNRSTLRQPIGDVLTHVRRVVSASSTCIFVETTSDFSAVDVRPGRAASEYWALVPKPPTNDPELLNRTPWALSFNADYLTPTSVPDQCRA